MRSPTSSSTVTTRCEFPGPRSTKLLFVILGTLLSLLALVFLLLPYPDLSARLFACLLLTLPSGSVGLYFLHCWWLLRQARVVVQAAGVTLQLPNDQEGWLFRSATVQLGWEEICCVQHDRQPVMAGGKPLDEYWIHSTRGNFVLTQSICTNPAEAAQLIMTYKQGVVSEVAPTPTTPLTPEQEEQQLKEKTGLAITMLVVLLLAVFSFVLAEAPWLRSLLEVGAMVQHVFTLFFIVATIAGIVARWRRARRARAQLLQQSQR